MWSHENCLTKNGRNVPLSSHSLRLIFSSITSGNEELKSSFFEQIFTNPVKRVEVRSRYLQVAPQLDQVGGFFCSWNLSTHGFQTPGSKITRWFTVPPRWRPSWWATSSSPSTWVLAWWPNASRSTSTRSWWSTTSAWSPSTLSSCTRYEQCATKSGWVVPNLLWLCLGLPSSWCPDGAPHSRGDVIWLIPPAVLKHWG